MKKSKFNIGDPVELTGSFPPHMKTSGWVTGAAQNMKGEWYYAVKMGGSVHTFGENQLKAFGQRDEGVQQD